MTRLLWSLAAAAVVIAGAVVYLGSDAQAEAPRFTLAPVTRGSIVTTVSATGTLEPVDTVEVGTQTSGTIATLGADFNQSVTRGQVVATLDPAVLSSQVNQAEATVIRLTADLERAQVQRDDALVKLGRAEQLSARQLIPAQDVDTARSDAKVAEVAVTSARAQLDQAQASLDQARVNLSHTVITSPVSGIVLSRNVEVGQTVSAGLQAPTLFVIARSLDVLQLSARIDESDVGRVAAGQPVSFAVDAYPGRPFAGTVRQVRLQPTVVQNVVSYTTIIDVPNPKGLLKPGMTATLDVEVARVDDVLHVPAAALRFQPTDAMLAAASLDGRAGAAGAPAGAAQAGARRGRGPQATVWMLRDGQLTPAAVQAGLSDAVSVAVQSGEIHEGDQVVTGVAAGLPAAAAPAAGGSPLMPSFPRRPGTGGGARPGR
ncbi:MAG: efflux RND transporter periplasmic adaptor subunit [Vicinamibacterales bacterium]